MMDFLSPGLSSLQWFAQTTRPAKTFEVADTLIVQLMRYFKLPPQYAPFAEWGIRVGLAFLILLLVAFLARRKRMQRIVKWIDDLVGMVELKEVDHRMFAFLVSTATWVFGLLIILSVLKLNALLATLGFSAGALATITAFANKEFIGHFFAGFALQARGQIQKENVIEVMGILGKLQSIGMTACQIEDFNGVIHFVPNNKMLNEKLTNYSMAKRRRVSFQFTYDPSTAKVEEIEAMAKSFLEQLEGQEEGREGSVNFGAPNEKGLEVNINAYFTPEGWFTARSKGHTLLLQLLEDHGVEFGLPQQIVLLPSAQEEVVED